MVCRMSKSQYRFNNAWKNYSVKTEAINAYKEYRSAIVSRLSSVDSLNHDNGDLTRWIEATISIDMASAEQRGLSKKQAEKTITSEYVTNQVSSLLKKIGVA